VEENKQQRLREVALLFLKLGIIGFGGPAVHIALMEEEVVRKRGWMDHQHFLDLVGATNLIPGPNSTEMTMHCGQERAGWRGLMVAGCCFIVPAVIITAVFAWAYQKYGQLPQVERFIYGIKPAIISVIVAAMFALGRKSVKNFTLGVIGICAAVAVLLGINEIVVFFAAGLIGIILFLIQSRSRVNLFFPFTLLQINTFMVDVTRSKLFWIFLKVGSILYGSGYVLFAFLDAELVAKGLLTKQQLIDAIAVGQFTPGPVFSAATFIGWQIGSWPGALAATIGIFLPSFLFVAFLNPLVPKLRQSRLMAAFLDTLNVVAIAVILAVVIEMCRISLTDWRTVLIAVLSFGVTLYYKRLNTAFVVLGGAILGYVLTYL
jgi:chromate transporter